MRGNLEEQQYQSLIERGKGRKVGGRGSGTASGVEDVCMPHLLSTNLTSQIRQFDKGKVSK